MSYHWETLLTHFGTVLKLYLIFPIYLSKFISFVLKLYLIFPIYSSKFISLLSINPIFCSGKRPEIVVPT